MSPIEIRIFDAYQSLSSIFSYIMRITCILNMTVNLTFSPPMTTDNICYRTIISDLFATDAMYRRREFEVSACSISLSTKQGSRWYHY